MGELRQSALPQNLVFLIRNRTKTVLEKSEGVCAFQQGPTARALPFSVLLLQFPGLELAVIPAEILRRHAMQRSVGADAKSRENLGGNFIKVSRPAPKRARGFVVQLAIFAKKPRFG